MRARIFQPPRSPLQSGRAGTNQWLLEFEPSQRREPDPLMGWIGGADTQSQVKLEFATREEAVLYAERHGIPYDLEPAETPRIKPKAYADNFRYNRRDNWTH
jgi:hypothetical protein